MRLLVVEDSKRLRDSLETGLRRRGYAIDSVEDGRRGLIYARTTDYDVIVLDIMLPEMDGLEVLRRAREHGVETPVLLLTARDAVNDRVNGLRTGADDYVVKPFAFDELVARIEALARRRHGLRTATIRVGDLEIAPAQQVVKRGGKQIDLKPREFAILEYLAHRRGTVVRRSELEEHVYDQHSQVNSNAIDSAICILRGKLGTGAGAPIIQTRRGIGYVLSECEV